MIGTVILKDLFDKIVLGRAIGSIRNNRMYNVSYLSGNGDERVGHLPPGLVDHTAKHAIGLLQQDVWMVQLHHTPGVHH